MQVILLERIPTLGQMGDEVRVKDGYARNFLLPQGKALRANKLNREKFESQRVELEARNLERQNEASSINDKLDGNSYVVIRSAGESGQLYGSVSNRDIAAVLDENGFKVARAQVALNQPIKMIGLHDVKIALHPEVESTIVINVARSEDEAERQAKGEDLTGGAFDEVEEAADDIDLSEIFEDPEAAEAEIVEAEADEGEETEPSTEASEEAAADGDDAASGDEEETKS